MNLLSIFKRKPKLEAQFVPSDDFARSDGTSLSWLPMQFVPHGMRFTPEEATMVGAVWAAIRVVSTALAQCTWNVYQRDASNRRQLMQDQVYWLLNHRPNPHQTAFSFRQFLVAQAYVWGNGYAEVQRDALNRPVRLWLLPSDRVTPKLGADGGITYELRELDGSTTVFAEDEIFRVPGPAISNWFGDSVVVKAAKAIALAEGAESFASSYYANGAVVGSVVKINRPLQPKEQATFEEDWKAAREGAKKAHKTLFLKSYMEFVQSNVDGEKSAMIESRKFSVIDIARFFGVPPHKIASLEGATFSNIEQQSIDFVNDCLAPWCVQLQQEADYKLFSPRSPRQTEIDLSRLLMGDMASRSAYLANLRNIGALSANEVREREGLNPIGPEGDLYLVQGNLLVMNEENLSKPEPQPAPAPPIAPPQDGEPDQDEEPMDEEGMMDAPHEALAAAIAPAITRFANKLRARRADLERSKVTPDDIDKNLEAERQRGHPKLAAECIAIAALVGVELQDADILVAATSIEAGVDPLKAAEHLVTASVAA